MNGKVYIDTKNGINDIEGLIREVATNKQVKFHMQGDDYVYGGIWIADLSVVICGECGGQTLLENIDYLYVYSDWADITEAVTGSEAESWANVISE